MFFLQCSKYADLKLGDGDPEYNTGSWFVMLFACGMGVGLFFYGVGEPIAHYTANSPYFSNSYLPDNMLAKYSLTLTVFHYSELHRGSYFHMNIPITFQFKFRFKRCCDLSIL